MCQDLSLLFHYSILFLVIQTVYTLEVTAPTFLLQLFLKTNVRILSLLQSGLVLSGPRSGLWKSVLITVHGLRSTGWNPGLNGSCGGGGGRGNTLPSVQEATLMSNRTFPFSLVIARLAFCASSFATLFLRKNSIIKENVHFHSFQEWARLYRLCPFKISHLSLRILIYEICFFFFSVFVGISTFRYKTLARMLPTHDIAL